MFSDIIDGVRYTDHMKTLVLAPKDIRGRFVVPIGVEKIQFGAFGDCTELTEIVLPNSVTRIGCSTFAGCTSITSVLLPEGLTNIEAYAFDGCKSLKYVSIPDSIVYIGDEAFSNCPELKSLYIPSATNVTGHYIAKNCHPDFTFFCGSREGQYWREKWDHINTDGRKRQSAVTYNVPRWWYEKFVLCDTGTAP